MNRPVARLIGLLLLLTALTAAFASIAGAVPPTPTGRYVYWTNFNGSLMRIDAAGGAAETVVANAGSAPNGVAIDRSTGRIYWAVRGNNQIHSIAADGSDEQALNTGGAALSDPVGVAIDPRRNRVYWANASANSIGWAQLDNSAVGGTQTIDSNLIAGPQGIAIDPVADKVFWANTDGISVAAAGWAKLDGSDAGAIGSAGPNVPVGMAFVPSLQQVFWAYFNGSGVSWAPASGGTETPLDTPGVSPASSGGIGYDAVSDRLLISGYSSGEIQYAASDGSGGGILTSAAGSPWGSPVATGAGVLSSANTPLAISTNEGAPKAGTLKLQNTGTYPIQIIGTASSVPEFSTGAGCPSILVIGESCELTVTFKPSGASPANGTITVATDAGKFPFTVNGSATSNAPTGIHLNDVHAVKRCAEPLAAGTLSVAYTSRSATPLTVTLQRSSSQRRKLPTRCPARSNQTGFVSKLIGKKSSKNFNAIAGTQSSTLKQLFGTKSLKAGRYRMLFNYKNAAGTTTRKGTWFWVLDK